MKQRGRPVEQIKNVINRNPEAIPGVPLVEIAGDRRVLIENHLGIVEYSTQRIIVRVKFGFCHICGCGLTVAKMSKEQLVIFGRIDGVSLERRC